MSGYKRLSDYSILLVVYTRYGDCPTECTLDKGECWVILRCQITEVSKKLNFNPTIYVYSNIIHHMQCIYDMKICMKSMEPPLYSTL